MNIGFDSKRLFNNFTGLGNYSRTLLKNLGEFYPENHYHLYSPRIGRNEASDYFLNNPVYLPHLPSASYGPLWRSYFIHKQLTSDHVGLFHGLSHEIPFNLRKTGIKSVVTIHDLIFRIHPETYAPADRLIYDLKFRYACRHADRIIAISESTKKDIIRFYGTDPGKIEVIYQACNPAYYRLQGPDETKAVITRFRLPADYLLSVGSIEPRKNLKRVIESYRFLPADLRIPLVVVGRGGKYRLETEKMVIQAGLEDRVIWIQGLNNPGDMQALYQNARILLYPSLYEGFGLPVAEALLSRTPVITSNRSSLPEAGGPGTVYINPTSTEDIADAIGKVLTDSALRQNMVETGHEYAQRTFKPEKVTRQVIECYRAIRN
jgi:glycosyltransferase involved in cell wall biosynthesis